MVFFFFSKYVFIFRHLAITLKILLFKKYILMKNIFMYVHNARCFPHTQARAKICKYMYVAFYDIVVFVWIFHKTILSILYGIFGNIALSFFFQNRLSKVL